MNFEIDLTNAVKIVTKKDDATFIEYTIDDGKIVDVSIVEREKTTEEKVEELKSNPDVQKINKLITLSDNAGVLTKMVDGKYTSIADVIKDSVKNEPIETVIKDDIVVPIKKQDIKIDNSKNILANAMASSEIMKLDEKMDETAKVFRGVIAEKLSEDEPKDVKQGEIDNDIDKALAISDRDKRINYLKDVISKINTKKEEDNE